MILRRVHLYAALLASLCCASQGTPQQQQPKRPDSAHAQTKAEPKTAPVATAPSAETAKRDTTAHRDESGPGEKRPSFLVFTLTDAIIAAATCAMAVVAALQLVGFNRQGKVIDAHVIAMEAAAKAMEDMAGSGKNLHIAVTRLENRLTMFQEVMKAKGSQSPYRKD